jgi:DNA-binding response OmpR family regulator
MLKEKSVLIVDDEIGVRDTLKRGIYRQFNRTDKRVSIIEAGNGIEAIALANSSPPDLIIMDIRMPIMDGLKACSILRRDSRFTETIIIMLTCEITEESTGLLSGADDYIIKPFDIKTLLIRIERGLFKRGGTRPTTYSESDSALTKIYFVNCWLHYEIARAKRYQHPLSLLLIKLKITDSKQSSDSTDVEVIKLLTCRASDPLIKWGDNTFAILLTETCADDAILLAKNIHRLVMDNPHFSHPSIGIANLEDTLNDDLILNAENSLMAAIDMGKIVLNRLSITW